MKDIEKNLIVHVKENNNLFSNHETRINNIESSVNELEENALTSEDIVTLQSSISTNTQNISSLQSTVNNHTANISNIESAILTNANNISLVDAKATQNQTNISSLQTSVNSHNTRITALENSSGGSSGGGSSSGGSSSTNSDYLTSVDEITKLNYKPGNYFSTGGDFLNTFGLKLAKDVRITQYFASLGNDALPFVFNFNLSSIPSGITSFSVNIYINSAFKSTKTVSITNGVGTVSYNYSPTSLSTIVMLELADTNLDGAILDSIGVTLATGQSVLCFNKPAERHFATSKVSGQNLFVLTSQTSNVATFGVHRTSVNFNIGNYSSKKTITLTDINVQRARVYPQMQAGSSSLAYNILVIGNSTNTVYFLTATSGLAFNNDMVTGPVGVIDAYLTNQAQSGNAVKICGTTTSLTPFIVDTTNISNVETLTLNSTDLPSEFVDCCPVDDGFLYSRSANQETGFVLTHKTGKILYFPNQNSDYCIDIGVGSNATGMLRETSSVKQIKIYFSQGNCCMKCLLEWNSTTNKWEKVGIYKYYQNYEYVLDYSYTTSDNCMCKNKTTRAWQKLS